MMFTYAYAPAALPASLRFVFAPPACFRLAKICSGGPSEERQRNDASECLRASARLVSLCRELPLRAQVCEPS